MMAFCFTAPTGARRAAGDCCRNSGTAAASTDSMLLAMLAALP